MFRTRFAPSPTGPLHLGHAYSAMLVHDFARQAPDGVFLLRIDDLDQSRARPEWEDQIYEDLTWLGIRWDEPVRRQSYHFDEYRAAIARLTEMGLTYPCRCSRRDIRAAAAAPQEGAAHGPGGILYPGTCRGRPMSEAEPNDAIRLDMDKATQLVDEFPTIFETGVNAGSSCPTRHSLMTYTGDIVLAAPGMAASYFLSVVVDDAAQQISYVIRGEDLFGSVELYVCLSTLLGYPNRGFTHHKLIRDEHGKRLAKRDDARAIAKFRAEGATPDDIRHMVGL